MSDDRELLEWQQAWRDQATPDIDLDDLREKVRRQNRREKLKSLSEAVFSVFVIGLCLRASLLPDTTQVGRALALLAVVGIIGFSFWVIRSRMQHWKDSVLDMASLIELEKKRWMTRVRYWRINAWGVLCIWIGMGLFTVLVSIQSPGSEDRIENLHMALAANFVVLLFTVINAYRIRLKSAQALKQLEAMGQPLGED